MFEKIELPLINVLSRIECRGALIDSTLLFEQSAELETQISMLEQEAWDRRNLIYHLPSNLERSYLQS